MLLSLFNVADSLYTMLFVIRLILRRWKKPILSSFLTLLTYLMRPVDQGACKVFLLEAIVALLLLTLAPPVSTVVLSIV